MSCHASARALSLPVTRIGHAHVGVADELGLPAIVMGNSGRSDCPTGWSRKSGETNPTLSLRSGERSLGWGRICCGQRLGVLPGPAAMLGQDRLGIVVGMIMQGEEEVARRLGEIGLQLDGPAEAGQCLIEAALILEDVAQVVVGLGQVGLELDGPVIGGDRLVEPALSLRALPRLLWASAGRA